MTVEFAAFELSNDALAALGLVYPLQMLLIAVAVGTSVGINSLISRRLGAVDRQDPLPVQTVYPATSTQPTAMNLQ